MGRKALDQQLHEGVVDVAFGFEALANDPVVGRAEALDQTLAIARVDGFGGGHRRPMGLESQGEELALGGKTRLSRREHHCCALFTRAARAAISVGQRR